MNVALLPDQAAAVNRLFATFPNAQFVELAPDKHLGVRAVITLSDREARWFAVDCAGTVREQGVHPDQGELVMSMGEPCPFNLA